MAALTDSLNELLGARTGQISRRIDADEGQTATALQAAIPALMAALNGEVSRGESSGLRAAIERDHDGSILDQLDDYLGGDTAGLSPRTTNGSGILSHVLGDQEEDVARALSAKSGLDLGSILGKETSDVRSKNPDIGDILDSLGGGGSSGGSSGGGGGLLDSLKDMFGGGRSG